jgi:hypothetical protein
MESTQDRKNSRIVTFLFYCKRVLFQWINILGFLPVIYGYVQTYLPSPYNLYQIPVKYLYPFLPVCLFYASYRVWLEEKERSESLQKKFTRFTILPRVLKLSVKKHLQSIELESGEAPVVWTHHPSSRRSSGPT